MITKRPSLCLQGWFSFNVAPNPNSPSTLLEWHVRATLHKHRRRPWWEAALSVASTVRFGDPKNVQTHKGSTANLSKNMQKYLKNSCPISYKNECVRSTSTSWLFSNISNVRGFQPPGTGVLRHSFQAKKTTMETCQVRILKSLPVYPPSHSKLDQKPSMSWMNCLIHQW